MVPTQNKRTAIDPTRKMNHTVLNTKREFHNEEKSTYWMPKDDEEQQRLTGQHFAFKDLYNGNLLSSVRKTLDFEKGVSVLDIGCGSGVWIMDMIHDYPNSIYHGCDIVDTVNKNLKIDQFTYNYGNIIKGLPYADNTFDFINMRLFIFALREDQWPGAIEEAIRVLKPGGMFQSTEIYTKLPEDSSSPYFRFVTAARAVATSKKQNPLIALKLEDMFSSIDSIDLVQSDLRYCDLSSGTSTAKKFAWDCMELTKSAMPHTQGILGLNNKEDALKFLDELKHCISHTNCFLHATSFALKKKL